jgi:cation transporter-like permease
MLEPGGAELQCHGHGLTRYLVVQDRRGDACFWEGIVSLIFYYLAFMVVGDFAAYLLGLFTEYEWGPHVSLIVFLALYFLSLWVSWVLAVWVTRPKSVQHGA